MLALAYLHTANPSCRGTCLASPCQSQHQVWGFSHSPALSLFSFLSSSKLPAVPVLQLVSKSPIFSLWSSSAIPRLASGRLRTSTHPGLRAHIISPRGRTKGTLPYLPHYSLNRGWECSVWDLCTTFSRAPPREPVKRSGRRHVRSSKRERER